MVIKNKVLAIPHIGTAFGHFYRLVNFLDNFIEDHDVCIVIPEPFVAYCRKFLNPKIQIITRKIHFQINNVAGMIDNNTYELLLEENDAIYQKLKPDLLIGDPGIQVAILSAKYSTDWIGIMHGCYLPIPKSLKMNEQFSDLLHLVWHTLNDHINKLINIGTNQKFSSWEDLRKTGRIIIPNVEKYEPSEIGEHLDINNRINNAWDEHPKVKFLITCCSAGNIAPSSKFLSLLADNIDDKIYVAGVNSKKNIQNIVYLDNNINYRHLVDNNTVVITHGGHGTLQAIRQAKKVFMIPSDFDQLYNSILASTLNGWNLVFDKNWEEIINSKKLFKREIFWDNLKVSTLNNELEILGLNIYPK